MKLSDINYTLLENVEKAAPILEKYICNLIAKPYKKFLAEHGLKLKKFYESVGEDSLSKIKAALIRHSAYSYADIKEDLYSFNALTGFRLLHGYYPRHLIENYSEISKPIQALLQDYETKGGYGGIQSRLAGDSLRSVSFLIKAIDNKSLPANVVQEVFNCDPIYTRGSVQGISQDKLKAPFAKAVARWVYDPEVQRDLKLPQDTEFLREQLVIFNRARSAGLNIDIDNIASYEQFMQIMEPYQADLDKVDKYALSGLDLVASIDRYRIWDLSWIPDDNDPKLHKTIGDAGWCVKELKYFQSYTARGKCYLVTKVNKKYALIHFASGEYKNVQNVQINDPDASKVLSALLSSDIQIIQKFVDEFYKTRMPSFVADAKTGELKQLAGNFAQFKKDPTLISVLTEYADKIEQEPIFKLEVAEHAGRSNKDALIQHLKQNHYVRDLEVLAQVDLQIFTHIAELLLSNARDYRRQVYASYFYLGKRSSEMEDIVNSQISGGIYNGFIAYIDLLSSSPSPNYDFILEYWATTVLDIVSKTRDLTRYSPFDGMMLPNNLKSIVARGKSEQYNDLKKFILEAYRQKISTFQGAPPSGSLQSLADFIIITGDISWEEGISLLNKLYSLDPKHHRRTMNKLNQLLVSAGRLNITEPYQIYTFLEEFHTTGGNQFANLSDESVDILEKKLADLNLKLAVQYAIDFKGPWPYLEKLLLEYRRKKEDEAAPLIERYKKDVLYGEDYE